MSETFAANAQKLAGTVCRILGWRPTDFWEATPAEILVIFSEKGDEKSGISRIEFETLMKRDGYG